MKRSFFLTIYFSFTFIILFGQNTQPARIRFIRSDKFLCSVNEFDIKITERVIGTIKARISQKASFEYIMFSEGLITIQVTNWENSWKASVGLDIEKSKVYYLKIDCSLTGIHLSTITMGDDEWNFITKENYESVSEEANNPIIPVEERYIPPASVVKMDTVKKVIYVNDNQNKKYTYQPFADVDSDIPETSSKNENRFALIIGNEDYSSFQTDLKSASNVDFARNDASAFRDYAQKTIGIPERNISFILDGTYGQIQHALSKMNLIAKNSQGISELIFYYAGHGMPDEQSKTPYLIPVDISGTDVTAGIKLNDIYNKLTEFPSKKVIVFLDACFTGGARGEALVANRGISVKPKEDALKGNIVVFNSSSGTQSSLPFNEKHHGIFTYFLLKKLKESQGNISLGDLSKFVSDKVSLETIIVNNKEQNPQTNVGIDLGESWQNWKLND